ncbi:MAG: NUDIX hydrolase [Myxococcales bacterium]|nr:NUDIX hydrolase [Myxococcales bacterium]MCB9553664.1 NUDIX hydrolase [Myxococcales bacterium]
MPRPVAPAGEVLYRDGRCELRRCAVPLRGGGAEDRALVVHPGSVVILPVLDDGRLVFIRNRRWQVGEVLWELPAGTLGWGEDPAAGAARELVEETGYRAGSLAAGAPFYGLPGISTEVMHPFVARGLSAVGQDLEADEEIEVAPLTVDEARLMLLDGRLVDGKSLAVLGRYLLSGGR